MNPFSRIDKFIRKYYPNEISHLFTLMLAVFSLFLFVEITDAVIDGDTQSFDNKILLLLRDVDDPSKALGPERLEYAVRDITALGSFTIVTLITLSVIIFLLLKKEYRSIIYVISSVVGGALIVQILKMFFARERPDVVTHLVSEITMSFPSGHTAISAVVYLSLAVLAFRVEKHHTTRLFIISTALFITFIVGLSRIYLGVHYPTDVLAGWTLGLFWALFCWFVTTLIEKKTNPVK